MVDAYAQYILEKAAATSPDDSLGSYITSLIRSVATTSSSTTTTTPSSSLSIPPSWEDLPEYEGLIELIQEHCGISTEHKAVETLQRIATAVIQNRIPSNEVDRFLQPQQQQQRQPHQQTHRNQPSTHSFTLMGSTPTPTGSVSSTTPFTTTHKTTGTVMIPMIDSSSMLQHPYQQYQHLQPLRPRPVIIDDENEFPALSKTTVDNHRSARTPVVSSSSSSSTAAAASAEAAASTSRGVMMMKSSSNEDYGRDDDGGVKVETPLAAIKTTATNSTINTQPTLTPHRADALLPYHLFEDDTVISPVTLPREEAIANTPMAATAWGTGIVSELSSSSMGAGSPTTTPHHHISTDDIAVALFHPTSRSRECSLDETTAQTSSASSPRSSSSQAPAFIAATAITTPSEEVIPETAPGDDMYFDPDLIEHCHSILLTMPLDMSPEAAFAASVLAQGCVYTAAALYHAALVAPPICRHLLGAGCYRSDCQYSHAVQQHTCLFWMRGRCGKGGTCRFLHGFHEKLLESVLLEQQQQQQIGEGVGDTLSYSTTTPYHNNSYEDLSPLMSGVYDSKIINNNTNPDAPSKSFASVALKGCTPTPSSSSNHFTDPPGAAAVATASISKSTSSSQPVSLPTVKIPEDLWNPHENRDSSAFYIADPIERYNVVMQQTTHPVENILDLHFQSTKTFGIVLETILPDLLNRFGSVWIVTGTGHHVGKRTHQKGGGALESAVIQWLLQHHYTQVYRGRDRSGQSGAVLVKRR